MNYKHNKPYYEIQFSELKDEKINVLSFEGKEKISDLFEYQIRIISDNPALESSKLLNKSATFIFNRGDEDPIKIYGIISHFEQYGKSNEYAFYKVVLVPKLWLLNLVYQNEIYQNVNIEKIIEMVLDDAGLSGSDFKIDFKNTYPENEYIVQYRESNFNFLNRRLEHYGIYYYFDHKNDKDVVVFTDTNQNLPDIGSKDPICLNLNKDPLSEKESIFEISCREKIVTGMVQLKDYNYLFPEKQLLAQSQMNSDDPGLYYDFGDNYCDENQGEFLAKVRNQELNCQRKIFNGTSDCRLFRAGYKFEMDNHYRQDWNDEYILTSVNYKGNQNSLFAFLPQQRKYEPTFECTFEAIPFSIEFKPERRTPKPRISGIMTAKVDAAGDGQYASIDDHGRYKVKIPFDLSDKQDGEASHFVRMTQSYSGPNYGMHFPLHKSAEVLLTFADGDPDRPTIVGTIPNPSNASPVTGGNQTQSVIRTAANNEIVIEDSSGGELIHINQACGNEILMKAEGPDIEIKQKCGNQILMKEAEGILIQDKFGNEVKLDAASGFMRLASPSHDSYIELGKSIAFNTNSALEAKYGQDTNWKVLGYSNDLCVGGKTEEFLGVKLSTVNGFEYKRNYAYIRERGHSKQDKIISRELKLDSQSKTTIIGGYGNADLNKIVLTDEGDVDILIETSSAAIKFMVSGEIQIETNKKIIISADEGIDIKSKKTIQIGKGMKMDSDGQCHFTKDIDQPSLRAKK